MEAVFSPMAGCCGFCFGILTVPCEASCGHWYCGDCIMKYWSYSSPFYPCKCPTCSEQIVWLKPEASQDQEAKVADVLQKIKRYNLLFSSVYGYFVRVFEFVKSVLHLDDPVHTRCFRNRMICFMAKMLAFLIVFLGSPSLIRTGIY